MARRVVVRSRSDEGKYLSTNRNFGFKRFAALNQWNWGPRDQATVFDSATEAREFVATRVRLPVTLVVLD